MESYVRSGCLIEGGSMAKMAKVSIIDNESKPELKEIELRRVLMN